MNFTPQKRFTAAAIVPQNVLRALISQSKKREAAFAEMLAKLDAGTEQLRYEAEKLAQEAAPPADVVEFSQDHFAAIAQGLRAVRQQLEARTSYEGALQEVLGRWLAVGEGPRRAGPRRAPRGTELGGSTAVAVATSSASAASPAPPPPSLSAPAQFPRVLSPGAWGSWGRPAARAARAATFPARQPMAPPMRGAMPLPRTGVRPAPRAPVAPYLAAAATSAASAAFGGAPSRRLGPGSGSRVASPALPPWAAYAATAPVPVVAPVPARASLRAPLTAPIAPSVISPVTPPVAEPMRAEPPAPRAKDSRSADEPLAHVDSALSALHTSEDSPVKDHDHDHDRDNGDDHDNDRDHKLNGGAIVAAAANQVDEAPHDEPA